MPQPENRDKNGLQGYLISRRFVIFVIIVGAIAGILLLAQELLVRRGGYQGGLYVEKEPVVTISGTVADAESSERLAGVEVSLAPQDLKTRTDEEGGFVFSVTEIRKDASYTIRAVLEGYEETVIEAKPAETETKPGLIIKLRRSETAPSSSSG